MATNRMGKLGILKISGTSLLYNGPSQESPLKYLSLRIFITSSFQSSVRHVSYSYWLSVFFITDLWNEGISYAAIFMHDLADDLQVAFTSALLIFKENLILVLESNNHMAEKTTY